LRGFIFIRTIPPTSSMKTYGHTSDKLVYPLVAKKREKNHTSKRAALSDNDFLSLMV
jgi:hypothetical protein